MLKCVWHIYRPTKSMLHRMSRVEDTRSEILRPHTGEIGNSCLRSTDVSIVYPDSVAGEAVSYRHRSLTARHVLKLFVNLDAPSPQTWGMEGGWMFLDAPGHILLITMYHIPFSWWIFTPPCWTPFGGSTKAEMPTSTFLPYFVRFL